MPVCAAVIVLSIGGSVVWATPAGSEPDVIAIRQAGYDLLQGTVTGMKQAIAAKADPKPYAEGAAAVARWGKLIPSLFPAGTETGGKTKAKPEIWSDRAGFEKAAANMNVAATKLSEVAKAGDVDGFAAQFKALTDTCGACHKQYRNRT